MRKLQSIKILLATTLCLCLLFVGDAECSGPGPVAKTLRGKVMKHFFDKMMGMPEPFSVAQLSRVLNSEGLVRELYLLDLAGHTKGQTFGADIRSLFPDLPSESVRNAPYTYYFANDSEETLLRQMLLNIVTFEESRWLAILTDSETYFSAQLQSFDSVMNDQWQHVDKAKRAKLSQKLVVPVLSPFAARIFLREGRWVDGAAGAIEDWTILRAYDAEGDSFIAVQYAIKASAREELELGSLYGIIAIKGP